MRALALLRRARFLPACPASGEYRKALEVAGVEIHRLALDPHRGFRIDPAELDRAVAQTGADFCIFSNPHNPSGAVLEPAIVLEVVLRLQARRCCVVVDEAFIDYLPDYSILPSILTWEGVLVLRSLTKFYAIPGIRIGCAAGPAATIAAIEHVLPSWPVGVFESAAAAAAVQDGTYAAEVRSRNLEARATLVRDLERLDILVFPAAANFVLADFGGVCRDVETLREHLIARHGIVVRTCSDLETPAGSQYARIAVRTRSDNARLVDALRIELHPNESRTTTP